MGRHLLHLDALSVLCLFEKFVQCLGNTPKPSTRNGHPLGKASEVPQKGAEGLSPPGGSCEGPPFLGPPALGPKGSRLSGVFWARSNNNDGAGTFVAKTIR